MKRTAIAILFVSLFAAVVVPIQAKNPVEVTVINTEPMPVIVQKGDIFNYWGITMQTRGRVTVFTVPEGKRLIVTDIDVNPFAGPESFPNEKGLFSLEGPNYKTKVRFNVTYPTPVHLSYTTGLVFEEAETVIIFATIDPFSDFPARQYDVTLSGRLVSK